MEIDCIFGLLSKVGVVCKDPISKIAHNRDSCLLSNSRTRHSNKARWVCPKRLIQDACFWWFIQELKSITMRADQRKQSHQAAPYRNAVTTSICLMWKFWDAPMENKERKEEAGLTSPAHVSLYIVDTILLFYVRVDVQPSVPCTYESHHWGLYLILNTHRPVRTLRSEGSSVRSYV